MTDRPTYVWSYGFSWGLTVSGGTLAVVSVLAYFLPHTLIAPDDAKLLCVIAFAGMVGFSVACANCTAAAAQHAVARSRFYPATFWPALVCTLGFCVTTGIGVHLGWTLMTQGIASHDLPDARLVNSAAVFIALAKPAMNWIIEGRRGIDRDDADLAEAAENARFDALRQAERDTRPSNVTHLPPRVRRTASGAAALGALAALGAPHDAAEAAPRAQLEPASDAPSEAPAEAPAAPQTQPDPDPDARRVKAREMIQAAPQTRLSNRAIARETGLSPSTIDRMVRELTPLRERAA